MRTWVHAHPRWSTGIVATIALLLGIAIGGASMQGEVDDLKADVADLENQRNAAEAEAEDAADELESQQDALTGRERDLRKREAEQRRRLARERREQRERLAEQQADLDEREADVSAAERAQDQNTITEGIWQLGRDYEAGLYRAPGGGGCYWAKLGSGNTDDIIDNGGFSKNQTIQIDSPFFETNDCGDWVKIG